MLMLIFIKSFSKHGTKGAKRQRKTQIYSFV